MKILSTRDFQEKPRAEEIIFQSAIVHFCPEYAHRCNLYYL
jgi:hypothetical protein